METARTRNVAVQMAIGETSSSVEVSEVATPIETTADELSNTVQNRLVQDLPL